MPLRWQIDHQRKFVHIVAEGPVTIEQMEEHFDAIAVADAMGYAKLFDATRAEPLYTDDDVMRMGARLSAYTANLPSGCPPSPASSANGLRIPRCGRSSCCRARPWH